MNNQTPNKTLKIQPSYIVISVIVIVIFSAIVFVFTNNTPSETSTSSSSSSSNSSTISVSEGSVIKDNNNEVIKQDENNVAKAGSYTAYSENLLAKAETGEVVIFFNASWCSSCQRTIRDINSNLNNIPSSLTILSADYDKETALRRKYGVTTQHTFVKVDKNGDLIKKQTSLNTLQDITTFAKN